MSVLRIIRSHMSQPIGGWSFPIPDGPVLTDVKLDGLLSKIKAHRSVNGFPPGDPENDVAKHYAKDHPWLISSVPDPDDEVNDAAAWIHRTWNGCPHRITETRKIEDRFFQCRKCLHFETLDCKSLSDEENRRLLLLNPVTPRKEHGWCLLRGWVCSVACQIQDPSSMADYKEKSKLCWLESEDPGKHLP